MQAVGFLKPAAESGIRSSGATRGLRQITRRQARLITPTRSGRAIKPRCPDKAQLLEGRIHRRNALSAFFESNFHVLTIRYLFDEQEISLVYLPTLRTRCRIRSSRRPAVLMNSYCFHNHFLQFVICSLFVCVAQRVHSCTRSADLLTPRSCS